MVLAGIKMALRGKNGQMDFSQIDILPMRPGWGLVYQGGSVNRDIQNLPGPLVLVCCDVGEMNEQFIDHKIVQGLIAVQLKDYLNGCLPDTILIAFVDACIALLKNGVNLYVHCGAGISRSTYIDCAIHMRGMGIGFDEAIEHIRFRRPQAAPNPSFCDQLKRIEVILAEA